MQRAGSCLSPVTHRPPPVSPHRRATAPLHPHSPTHTTTTTTKTSSHTVAAPHSTQPRRGRQTNAFGEEGEPAALTMAEELAALEARTAAWKAQQLADVHTAADVTGDGEEQATAAMETRLQQRRAAERTRAQQRLGRLLDTLEVRLASGTGPSTPPLTASTGDEAAPGAEEQLQQQPEEVAPQRVLPPLVTALSACELRHLVGRQHLSVEEREARWRLAWQHQFAVAEAQLRADEAEFRTSIEGWEGTWYGRLAPSTEETEATAEEERGSGGNEVETEV